MNKIEMPENEWEMQALKVAIQKYKEKQLNDEIRELLLVEGPNGLSEMYEQELENMQKQSDTAKAVLYFFFLCMVVYAVYLTYEGYLLDQKIRQLVK